MAIKREDMFGNGLVSMEYHPHKRIELRVAGFKIIVSKPYGADYRYFGHKTFKSPAIQISTNTTVTISFRELNLINSSILRAIDILNNENDGLIIDKNFEVDWNLLDIDNIPDNIAKIHKSGDIKNCKSIPYKEIKASRVYKDIKGKRWIYLGRGYIYRDGRLDNRVTGGNIPYCMYIYLDYDRLCKQQWKQLGTCISCEDIDIVDSYASKKRFIEQVDDIKYNINVVKSHYSTITFTPK